MGFCERLLFFIAGMALGSLLAKRLMNRPQQCDAEYQPTEIEHAVAHLMHPHELRLGAFMHRENDAVFVAVKEQRAS